MQSFHTSRMLSMRIFLLIGSVILAACGSVGNVDGKEGKEVVVVQIRGDTPFSGLTSSRAVSRTLQLRSSCAYQYEEVITDSAGNQVDGEAPESSFMIDTSGKRCSRRPSSWYVLLGQVDAANVQRYADLVARLMAGDYNGDLSTPSLKGRQPNLVEVNADVVELSYAIPPFNYLVKLDISKDPPRIVGSEKWQ